MDLNLISKTLDIFSELKVLVIGDIMVDEYLWGSVGRISPEAPVQIVDIERQEYRLGGCGNVINNLCSLGSSVSVASVIGDGFHHEFVLEEFHRLGVDTKCLLFDIERPTTKKTRIIAANQQIVRFDSETRKPIADRYEKEIIDFLNDNISLFDLIILSDYEKGVATNGISACGISNAKNCSVPLIVDPKGKNFSKYFGATVISPNTLEAALATDIEITDDTSAEKAGLQILRMTNCQVVLITRGKRGMTLLTASDHEALHIPARAREVYDVTGAGDTVVSVLGLAISSGLTYAQASLFANEAAGIVVGKIGASPVTRQELLLALTNQFPQTLNSKEKTLEELKTLLPTLKKHKKRIVLLSDDFTNLTGKHIHSLRRAKQLGDILIVHVNTNDTFDNLNNTSTDIISVPDRVQMLSAPDSVDYLLITASVEISKIIENLHPDVFLEPSTLETESAQGTLSTTPQSLEA
jgi:D-beta-D-heptose 7-phosphate kinase/D-beta-D-heptose 1-phosphate adenosyltransferase